MRVTLAIATIAILVLSPIRALAADLGIVARENDPFVSRLMREIEQLGLTVSRTASVEGSSDVAVLVVATDGALDLVDKQPDGSRRKRRLVAKGDALKVAEEVHALMLPLVERPPEPAPPPPPPPPPPPLVREEPPPPPPPSPSRTFEATVGAGVLLGDSTPGLAASLGLAVPAIVRAGPVAFGAGAVAIVGAVPEKVEADAGTTDIRPLLLGAELASRLELSRAFSTELALGAFAASVRFSAKATVPFQSRDESAWTFAPGARLRAAYAFGALALFVEGRMGMAFPPITVRFAGEGVHEWGRPWSTAGGGVAVAF